MTDEPRNRSIWRRLLRGGVIALLLGAIAWQVAKRTVDVDQYRPRIEAALADYAGLPVTIDVLELAWHPVPCLSARHVSIGAGDFHAVTARLDVFPNLLALLRWRIEIARIDLVEPAITLPASREQLESQWRSMAAHIKEARGDSGRDQPGGAAILINEFSTERALLRFGMSDARPIISTITATGIGGEHLDIALEAQISGTRAKAHGHLRVPSDPGSEGTGELTIQGVELNDFLAGLPEPAQTEWQARVEFAGKLGEEIALSVDGGFEPRVPHAIRGLFTGHARIAPDGKTRAEVAITGPGFAVNGSARLFSGEKSRVRVKSLRAQDAAFATLLAALARDPVELRPAKGAAVEVRDLELSLGSAPRFTAGVLEAHGVDLIWRDAPIARDLRLAARAGDGVIQIESLRGGPIDLRGAVTPDREAHRVSVDLSGSLALDETLLHAVGAPESIRAASGAVAIEQLRVDVPGTERSADYALRAQLAGGSARIESGALEESLTDIAVRITGDNSALRFETRVLGAALGPVSANAAVDQATGDTRGSLWLESASTGFLRDLGWRGRLSPVARAYSGPPLAFEILRDPASPQLRRIHIERSLAPRVEAALVWRSAPAKDPLPDVDVSADVPADALRGFLPEAAIASGNGTLRIRRSGGGAGFYGEADVTAISLADGAHIEKKPGEVLRVRMEGTAGERWDPLNLIFTGKDGSIPLAIGEHGLSAANLDVDLAAFSFMLVDGARAAGRLRGSFDYATRSAALSLDGVGLWLTPELGIERADGAIAINGGDWGVKELRVRGARMDATCDAAVQNERMIAKVTGARLDGDYVRELLQQVRALHFAKYEPDRSPPLSGEIAVALDQASYGRSEGKHVTGVIAIDQRDVHARDLSFEIEDGRVAGRVDIDVRDGEPPLVDLEVDFADLTRRFVDDLFEEESRGNPGKYTGKLRFKAPWYGEKKATMAEANGSLAGIGRSGTLIGRLGLGTKLVTVLRSTEALRGKLPAFSDEGLVFDTVRADLVMEQGRVEIRKFDLDSTSYAINATGEVNFRDDTSRIPIEVNAIRGVASLMEYVPVAGDALKIVNVRLVATGSPWDMQVRVASISDQLLGAGLAGPKAVIKGMRDVVDLMRRGSGGGAETAPAEAPAPPRDSKPTPEPAPPTAESP